MSFTIMSCFLNNDQEKFEKNEILFSENNADDIDFAPNEEEISCMHSDDCVVIDKGCCSGEKIIAVNTKSSSKLRSKRVKSCNELFNKKADEKIFNLCEGREIKRPLLSISTQCVQKKCEFKDSFDKQNPENDAEIEPTEDDIACKEGDSCVVIDKGCCAGEKRVAVNWKSIQKLRNEQRQGCMKLLADKAKKNIHDICLGRKVMGRFMSEAPRCHENKCQIN